MKKKIKNRFKPANIITYIKSGCIFGLVGGTIWVLRLYFNKMSLQFGWELFLIFSDGFIFIMSFIIAFSLVNFYFDYFRL